MEAHLRNISNAWRKGFDGRPLRWQRVRGTGAHEMEQNTGFAAWRKKGFSRAPHPDVDGDWAIAACAHSHYKAIRSIPTFGEDLVLITEDDVELKEDFPRLWQELWPWLPEEWDVLRLGWFGDHQNCSQVVNSHIDLAAWQQPPGGDCMYCGAQAYIVNPRSKQKVLSRFEMSGMTHADELLGAPTPLLEDAAEVPPLRSFVVWPMLASTHFNEVGYPAFPSDRLSRPTTTVAPTKKPWWQHPRTSSLTTAVPMEEVDLGSVDRQQELKRMQEKKASNGYMEVRALQQDKAEQVAAKPSAPADKATGTSNASAANDATAADDTSFEHSAKQQADDDGDAALHASEQRAEAAEKAAETNDIARRRAEKKLRAVKEELAEVQAQETMEEEAREQLEKQARKAKAALRNERTARQAVEKELEEKKKNYWITPKFPTAPPPPKIHWKPKLLPVSSPLGHPPPLPRLGTPAQHSPAKPKPSLIGKLGHKEPEVQAAVDAPRIGQPLKVHA